MPDLLVQVDDIDHFWNAANTIGVEVVAEPFTSGFDRRFMVRLNNGHVVLIFQGDWIESPHTE